MLEVNVDRCIGCGECEEVCSFGAIAVNHDIAVVDQDSCTMCGTCVDTCPEDALTLERGDDTRKASDLDAWRGVWVVAEQRNGELATVTYELLGKARGLADDLGEPLTAILMGHEIGERATDLASHGADRVLVVDYPAFATFTDEVFGNTLAYLARQERPEIILAGATSMGRSFIPRVATVLETGLTADCTELSIRKEDRALLQTRPAFGGNLMATIVCPNHRPQMATVRPHVFKAQPATTSPTAEIINVNIPEELLKSKVKVIESVQEQAEGPGLTDAEIIITAGRGMENKKNIALVEELAELMGAAIGASRAATDAGWLPERAQIGQTGVTVSPKLYIGCGVSGAIQHIVGIQGAEIIVAINKDPDAPLFNLATYGIVGDVKVILPLLVKRIKRERGIA